VMKIHSHEFETVFDAETREKTDMTQNILEQIRRAVIGESPFGRNAGYTGDMGSLPDLFQWEATPTPRWDNADDSGTPYTKGQPRGLWTETPNSADPGDDLAASRWGIGWRTRYLPAPDRQGENRVLTDAWGNSLGFFHDAANAALMVLSPGPDKAYDFGDPADPVEVLNIGDYDPALPENQDNLTLLILPRDFVPGFVEIQTLTVINATAGVTKARLFRGEGDAASQVRTAAVLIDADGDNTLDDWCFGSPGSPAFQYDDTTPDTIWTGARYLVCWNDSDDNNEIDSDEWFRAFVLNIKAEPGSTVIPHLTVNTGDFTEAP